MSNHTDTIDVTNLSTTKLGLILRSAHESIEPRNNNLLDQVRQELIMRGEYLSALTRSLAQLKDPAVFNTALS